MKKKHYPPPRIRCVRIGSTLMQAASGDDNDQVVVNPDQTVYDGNGGWSKQFNGVLVDDDDGHYFY